jgi:hypothetical protein
MLNDTTLKANNNYNFFPIRRAGQTRGKK